MTSSLKNYRVHGEIAPVDVEDGARAALMEVLKGIHNNDRSPLDSTPYRKVVITTAL